MNIILLGSGNVATHFGEALVKAGHRVTQVYSRTYAHASRLAGRIGAEPVAELAALDRKADLYLIAVSDDAIGRLAAQLPSSLQGLVVHTAGSVGLDVLAQPQRRYGVMYPVQTFSLAKAVDFSKVPLALEGSDEQVYTQLEQIAVTLSGRTFACNSKQRLAIHVAAVFVCNFTNHLYAVGADLLDRHGLAFDLVRPLILETAQKVLTYQPREVQTGPAVRNDSGTMEKHLALLADRPELMSLYQLISARIQSN